MSSATPQSQPRKSILKQSYHLTTMAYLAEKLKSNDYLSTVESRKDRSDCPRKKRYPLRTAALFSFGSCKHREYHKLHEKIHKPILEVYDREPIVESTSKHTVDFIPSTVIRRTRGTSLSCIYLHDFTSIWELTHNIFILRQMLR